MHLKKISKDNWCPDVASFSEVVQKTYLLFAVGNLMLIAVLHLNVEWDGCTDKLRKEPNSESQTDVKFESDM